VATPVQCKRADSRRPALNATTMARSDFPDDLLVRLLGCLNHRALCTASAASRKWRRCATSRCLWRNLLHQRWPALSSLPCTDERSFFIRLYCSPTWLRTTPEDVLVLTEISCRGEVLVSCSHELGPLVAQARTPGVCRLPRVTLYPSGTDLTLTTRFEVLVAEALATTPRPCGATHRADEAGITITAVVTLVRKRDCKVIRADLRGADCDTSRRWARGTGPDYLTRLPYSAVEWRETFIEPRHPERSFQRREAMKDEKSKLAEWQRHHPGSFQVRIPLNPLTPPFASPIPWLPPIPAFAS
jgi:hypothetical protein